MHNRSIRQNKFNLPSMRKLWKAMGGYDALVEYNECAVRQFLLKWKEHKEKGISHADFIKSQAEEVGIHLGYLDFDEYRQDVYLWYLIHPYGCIDTFVNDFKDDLKEFGYHLKSDFPNKSVLEKLIAGMRDAGIPVSVEDYKLDLDSYYRRSRNLLAHKLDKKVRDKLMQLYSGLQKDKISAWYPSLSGALSAPVEYTFDDYLLCTANLKNITDILTMDVYNGIDWSKFEIEKTEVGKKLRGFLQNYPRLQNGVKTYIKNKYGISLPPGELTTLTERIIGSSNNG